jgi:beta-glucosidase/6-phospho-beta-glucosidase/beta-galactosidase
MLRTLAIAIAITLLAACASKDEAKPVTYRFPKTFLFGAATAGYQVDMGCPTLPETECADKNSDWYQFATNATVVADKFAHLSGQDPAVTGPGHWELYAEDFDRAKHEVGSNALRMSLEWSRLFPASTTLATTPAAVAALANPAAVAHYHAVFRALKARGLTPVVTLIHYTLPAWLHDGAGCHLDFAHCTRRGWVDKDLAVREAAKYARFAAAEFGAEVDWWSTENEPFAILLPGYLQPTNARSNPPAVAFEVAAAKTVFAAMIEAHARMYDAVKAADTGDADGDGVASQVGLVYAMAPVEPKNPGKELDRSAAEHVFYLWNLAFLNAVCAGDFDGTFTGQAVHRADLEKRMDFLGLNYYVRATVEGTAGPFMDELSPLSNFNPLTLVTDEVYPRGIYEMAREVKTRYGLPVLVTENNGYNVDAGDYAAESRNVVETLVWLNRALAAGVDVRGYLYWSLMDNIEWNHGMNQRWGLYAVDANDKAKTRTARPLVPVLHEIYTTGAITPALRMRVGAAE